MEFLGPNHNSFTYQKYALSCSGQADRLTAHSPVDAAQSCVQVWSEGLMLRLTFGHALCKPVSRTLIAQLQPPKDDMVRVLSSSNVFI